MGFFLSKVEKEIKKEEKLAIKEEKERKAKIKHKEEIAKAKKRVVERIAKAKKEDAREEYLNLAQFPIRTKKEVLSSFGDDLPGISLVGDMGPVYLSRLLFQAHDINNKLNKLISILENK